MEEEEVEHVETTAGSGEDDEGEDGAELWATAASEASIELVTGQSTAHVRRKPPKSSWVFYPGEPAESGAPATFEVVRNSPQTMGFAKGTTEEQLPTADRRTLEDRRRIAKLYEDIEKGPLPTSRVEWLFPEQEAPPEEVTAPDTEDDRGTCPAPESKGYLPEWAKCAADIKLKRNGQEIDAYESIAKAINSIINLHAELQAFFREIKRWVPQVGWGFQFYSQVLEGQIVVRWGWKEYFDHRVFRWFQVHVDATIFKASAALEFGVRVDALAATFEGMLSAQISADLHATYAFERAGPDSKLPSEDELTFEGKSAASGGFRMHLVSDDICQANGAVATGLEAKAKINLPWDEEPFGIETTVYAKGLSFSFTFQIKGLGSYKKEIVFIEGSPAGQPWAHLYWPHKLAASFPALRRRVTIGWQRCAAVRTMIDEALGRWIALQEKLVRDMKPVQTKAMSLRKRDLKGAIAPYPLVTAEALAADSTLRPLWDHQWRQCRAAFADEVSQKASDNVRLSFLRAGVPLRTALEEEAREADLLLAKIDEQRAKLDEIVGVLRGLARDIHAAELKSSDGTDQSNVDPRLRELTETYEKPPELAGIHDELESGIVWSGGLIPALDQRIQALEWFGKQRKAW